ncbi:MAG: hypothetical protein U0S76_02260, partial [Pseudoxanthomonas sp.]|nr:hypothetical protein [Pseudoxanthomonas sp.]
AVAPRQHRDGDGRKDDDQGRRERQLPASGSGGARRRCPVADRRLARNAGNDDPGTWPGSSGLR